jgi:hypothetical protein
MLVNPLRSILATSPYSQVLRCRGLNTCAEITLRGYKPTSQNFGDIPLLAGFEEPGPVRAARLGCSVSTPARPIRSALPPRAKFAGGCAKILLCRSFISIKETLTKVLSYSGFFYSPQSFYPPQSLRASAKQPSPYFEQVSILDCHTATPFAMTSLV